MSNSLRGFKQLVAGCILFVIIGCAQEMDDLYILGSSPTNWESQLHCLIEDNRVQMESSGLYLLGYSLANSSGLTVERIFNDNSVIPIYFDTKHSRFELMPHSFIESDTLVTYYRPHHITNRLDSLLRNTECDMVNLKWLYRGKEISTYAIFNSNSGELEYDNILFFLHSPYSNTVKNSITRTEANHSSAYASDYDIVYCYASDNTMVGSAWISWTEYGYYRRGRPIYSLVDSSIVGYNYEYRHTRLACDFGSWRFNNASAIATIGEYVDNSGLDSIDFTYSIWVGPISEKPNDPINSYPPARNGMVDLNMFSLNYPGLRIDGKVRNIFVRPSYYILQN